MRWTQERASLRAGVALAVMFAGLYVYAAHTPIVHGDSGVIDPSRFKAEEEERLRASLRDPERAKFRDDFVVRTKSMRLVCGEINQRNEAGGFSGFHRFIAGKTFRAVEGPVAPDVMDELWAALCPRKR